MFDKLRLKEAVAEYKKRFVQTQWPDENINGRLLSVSRSIGM